jgi:hypothetical protein
MAFFFDSLTRVRAGTRTDRGGNEVADWSPDAVQRLVVDGLNIQPASQAEGNSTRPGLRTRPGTRSPPGGGCSPMKAPGRTSRPRTVSSGAA